MCTQIIDRLIDTGVVYKIKCCFLPFSQHIDGNLKVISGLNNGQNKHGYECQRFRRVTNDKHVNIWQFFFITPYIISLIIKFFPILPSAHSAIAEIPRLKNRPSRRDFHIKGAGMFVVSLSDVSFGFWSHSGDSRLKK